MISSLNAGTPHMLSNRTTQTLFIHTDKPERRQYYISFKYTIDRKICPYSQSSNSNAQIRCAVSLQICSIRYHDVPARLNSQNLRQFSHHFLSFRSFAQLTGLGGGGGGWSLRSKLVAYLGLGEASTALWRSREKFSAPTTEERYEERCIVR